MKSWSHTPRISRRRSWGLRGLRRWAIVGLLVLFAGCATVPKRAKGGPGIPDAGVVEPGPKGFYRIPLYDEHGDRMWLMIPYGAEVQSLLWDVP